MNSRSFPPSRPSRLLRRLVPAGVLVLATATAPASASDLYNFTASLFGTVGGAIDVAGEDPGLDQTGFQLGFAWKTQPKSQVGVRLGQIDMEGEQLEGLFDPELSYATIGGEYRYRESYYDSGVFLGLGLYQLEGIAGGVDTDDSSVGINLGATGDFPITKRLSFLAEISLHYADLEYAQSFAFAHFGLGFHF